MLAPAAPNQMSLFEIRISPLVNSPWSYLSLAMRYSRSS
jgi:hypothetical protein